MSEWYKTEEGTTPAHDYVMRGEFIPEKDGLKCPNCGKETYEDYDGVRFCQNCNWDNEKTCPCCGQDITEGF